MLAAFVGKYVGCGLVVRAQGYSWRHASAVDGLMNARGLMILIFINIGLAYELVTPDMFAILPGTRCQPAATVTAGRFPARCRPDDHRLGSQGE